ncbi:hypothetical protein [Rhizobium sp. MHM7A]|uniref:hypothetical protein n=1 Tax=Rhizobium sp. MHM7A TaxID=2583233 RepID=UPI0011074142|nr:hypothetical protein [Rhizobium sp. MHM7A]TLX16642.1 hypothetical protein FFR93_04685 [Rhizobium sp. MHM7A]
MLVDDALKNTVRHHLANWKTLRGVTPFYSKMFWPPVDADPAPEEVKEEKFTAFPSVQLDVADMFTEEELMRAQEEYPQYSAIIAATKSLYRHAKPFQAREARESYARPNGNATFDLLKKAYELEAKTAAPSWTPLEIAKIALKMKEFSDVLSGQLLIQISQGMTLAYKDGEIGSYRHGNRLMRGNLQKALHVIAKHALPPACIRKEHDFAAIAADIASQGYDAVFVYDELENGHCVTGLEPIKSIREMEKHLGSSLPVKVMEAIQGTRNRWSQRSVIRPFVRVEHGVRVFVVSGVIVAATAQTAIAEPGQQTQPFVEEIGNSLSEGHTGPYKTQFQECSIQPVLFKKFMEKANEVAANLKKIGENHYAMDLLLDAKGNYVIDIFDLATADYFALSPAIVADAIQKSAIRDMTSGVSVAQKFDAHELAALGSLCMRMQHCRILKYTEDTEHNKQRHDIFGDTEDFSSIVENTAKIRELLQADGETTQSERNADEDWLAEHLGISENKRKEYDLKGFAEAVRKDFCERFPGTVDDLWNSKDLFHLVPILDAALWFKKKQQQTWRYCTSNECDKYVTVRPIDSAPSRSERRSAPKMVDPFARSVTERYRDSSLGLYNADAHYSGFMQIPDYDPPSEAESADVAPGEDDVADFFLTLLEEDKS